MVLFAVFYWRLFGYAFYGGVHPHGCLGSNCPPLSSPFHLYQVYLAYQYTAGKLTPVLGFRRQQRWVEAPREQQYMQQRPQQVQTVPRKQIRPASRKEV